MTTLSFIRIQLKRIYLWPLEKVSVLMERDTVESFISIMIDVLKDLISNGFDDSNGSLSKLINVEKLTDAMKLIDNYSPLEEKWDDLSSKLFQYKMIL